LGIYERTFRRGRGRVEDEGEAGLVGNDNCVSFNQLKLQIAESPLRAHFVKATVKVRHYQDGSYAIFHGQRCLGRYDKIRQERGD
jgi:hypothetical protein